jgi:hypothetical protein
LSVNQGTITHPICSSKISSKTLKGLSKWNYTSISLLQNNDIQAGTKLSDLFEIKRGVATGANDFFILTLEQIDDLHIPFELLTPIL